MSDVEDRLSRLRKAGRLRRRSRRIAPTKDQARPAPTLPSPPGSEDLLALSGMEVIDDNRGSFLLRTLRYELAHQQGPSILGDLLELPPGVAALTGRDSTLSAFDFRRIAFIDTETSGLAGGAGTIVFLTGVGSFEEDTYVVRQYFARNPAEEPAYLQHLSDLLLTMEGLVSFNGKSFDMPLLRSRFIMAGLESPADHLPHLDLLHPARRLWRDRLGACNFGNLETQILNYHRSGQDVASWLIPSMWFRYANNASNAADMERVLYHNEQDIVSMVPLAHILCGIFSGVIDPHPADLLALARNLARQGQLDEAESAYRRALEGDPSRAQRADIIMGLAALLKKKGEREKAAIWWQAMVTSKPLGTVDPYIELAKYHEWETKDLHAARRWTVAALEDAAQWRPSYERGQIISDLNHRLKRLQRKLGQE